VVLHQLLLEVLVAAKVREEQLVLRVQRRAFAKDAKVEVVGRLDEASAAAPGRRLLVIATKTWVGVMVSSSLMIGNISVPCATWIVDDKPGTSGIWNLKRLTGWSSFLATCQIRVTLTFFTG
jgi:hypothetical protein